MSNNNILKIYSYEHIFNFTDLDEIHAWGCFEHAILSKIHSTAPPHLKINDIFLLLDFWFDHSSHSNFCINMTYSVMSYFIIRDTLVITYFLFPKIN